MVKDQQILALIRENPFISQQELSKKLGLSRSAVAGYISTLTKKGEIVGRAYIVKEESRITCIGGANIDRKSQTMKPIQYGTSNPASVKQSSGGISRNVAENLGRLGCEASLITLIGDDQEGKWLLEETKRYGVDVSQCLAMNKEKTGSYTSIFSDTGEMILAVADMQIYDEFSIEFMEARWSHIASSHIIFADSNLPEDSLDYLIGRCEKEQLTLCVNPVSAPKARRLPSNLHGVDLLIANRDEASAVSGTEIVTVEDCKQASELITQRGVNQVMITMGKQGVLWTAHDGRQEHLLPLQTDILDSTGVEESLVSGILFGLSHGDSFEQAVRLGMAASAITWQTSETNADLTADQLYSLVEKCFE
ncbi:winged helix-turn-helix transcriptional regulator [Halobacillus shinanisalinarum]|uniref:Winged helix-turn-helix transcriptional regulator n=1 Tax=Halobacillus shinanisalinarum TaxID=2932258 RepID=A0ABY4GXG7_9BACI|nr:carbohydrate kinase [Halobacillus shinanisalinarum]UOQ92876.1 winged helix-turn-helix transcriptional regulator [Halobacillus shinanisalinarum]